MKDAYKFIIRILFLFVLSSVFQSCKKDDKRENLQADLIQYKINSNRMILPSKIFNSEKFDVSNFFNYVYGSSSEPIAMDLAQIKKRGKLIALTGYGNTSYFIYKGMPMGYEYELLQLLADHLGVDLEIVIVNDMNEIFNMLNRGEGDIIADNLTITKEREAIVNFTIPHNYTWQVLVQKKPKNWRKINPDKLEKMLIRNPVNLIGKEIHVRKESSYYARLMNLSEEIGGDINIVEVAGDTETDELIMKVAEGEIPYTIADENIALVNKSYYPDLDISTAISFSQRIAWAVRENSPQLQMAVNAWLKKIKKEPAYYSIYNKYYKNKKVVEQMVACTRNSNCGRNISPFDKIIIRKAKELDWDWRLLAALIYQESKFDPAARSWTGAAGLMQLMPATALHFGADDISDPEQSIEAGTQYIKWLDNYWKKRVDSKTERIKFIIASYNVGQEHIADAQRLTEKYNKNPMVWDDNVAYFIVQKSRQKYCTDPVVKYGYCRGVEPFNYVNEIFERYEHYRKLIKNDVANSTLDVAKLN